MSPQLSRQNKNNGRERSQPFCLSFAPFEELSAELFFVFVGVFVAPKGKYAVKILKGLVRQPLCAAEGVGQGYLNRAV